MRPTAATKQTGKIAPTHLVLNYHPSQPHGWPATGAAQGVGATVGQHVRSRKFTHNGRRYHIGLLSYGQPGGSADPLYADVPADPTINFRQSLKDSFGTDYAFRYAGGFLGRNEFNVQSYSVFAAGQTESSPLLYGADLYVVYHPDLRRGDPEINPRLRWIQVATSFTAGGSPEVFVDNGQRANPFFLSGGLTSIYGKQVFNFYYGVARSPLPGDETVLSDRFIAEIFLVRDTGSKDAAGKDVIAVFGGIRYGWQVREVQR
ncbi:hypothetical protein C1I99_04715 [Micromonospora deserti]|uniref:Transporter n=2 Tax=Micromonospora deserti TaxID=2070366 RepID=A0A2W2CVQ6_9ACTN|nr:hypothetical protein C1I99_04715 [Micromonospora deserti]